MPHTKRTSREPGSGRAQASCGAVLMEPIQTHTRSTHVPCADLSHSRDREAWRQLRHRGPETFAAPMLCPCLLLSRVRCRKSCGGNGSPALVYGGGTSVTCPSVDVWATRAPTGRLGGTPRSSTNLFGVELSTAKHNSIHRTPSRPPETPLVVPASELWGCL